MRVELDFIVTHVQQSSVLAEQGVRARLEPDPNNTTGNVAFAYRAGELWLQVYDRAELSKYGSGRKIQVSFES